MNSVSERPVLFCINNVLDNTQLYLSTSKGPLDVHVIDNFREVQYIFLKLNVSTSVAIPQFMKKIQRSLYGTVRFAVPATWCLTVVRMRT
ncbi:unnamed protein product [Timema podura]|uniref:Uncharacterized protein n=1 Tax=Timema podura TaxID=61482 RepID=A0ABN7PNA1_TIMPD|nr:unnamed protein product [Timema podura]